MKHHILFSFLLIVAISACTAVVDNEAEVLTQPAAPDSSDEVDLPTSFPTQTILLEPTPVESFEDETGVLGKGNQMLIFLEVIQTTSMGEKSGQGPAIGVGPHIYLYDPDNKVLSLNETIVVEPETELLIGGATVLQTPNQEYEKREISQFPSMQPAVIQIIALDMEAGMLHLKYDNETFTLAPGESRTFKQTGDVSNATNVVTIVTNHGYIADIQLISPDSSWR